MKALFVFVGYESARTLAQKNGDQRLLQAAEGKLKEL